MRRISLGRGLGNDVVLLGEGVPIHAGLFESGVLPRWLGARDLRRRVPIFRPVSIGGFELRAFLSQTVVLGLIAFAALVAAAAAIRTPDRADVREPERPSPALEAVDTGRSTALSEETGRRVETARGLFRERAARPGYLMRAGQILDEAASSIEKAGGGIPKELESLRKAVKEEESAMFARGFSELKAAQALGNREKAIFVGERLLGELIDPKDPRRRRLERFLAGL